MGKRNYMRAGLIIAVVSAIGTWAALFMPTKTAAQIGNNNTFVNAPVSPATPLGDNNTVVNASVSPGMGSNNTILGATDANGNAIYNRGGLAIGSATCAGSTGVAIGAGARAGC